MDTCWVGGGGEQLSKLVCHPWKHPDGQEVIAPDFGSQGHGFESHRRLNSAPGYMMLHCAEPFIITLRSS